MYKEKQTLASIVLGLTIIFAIYSHASYAQPPGMMMHDFDEEYIGQMMRERGYTGPQYGSGYPGRHMGPMLWLWGPMMMKTMMTGYLYASLDLSKEQRDTIQKIQINESRQHLDLMGKMMKQSGELFEIYNVEKPNPETIGKVYDEIYKIKREMIQEHIRVRNQIYDLLTEEQKDIFRRNDPFLPFLMYYGMMGIAQ
jgi:Spy/CpxP family protein refolding chaperone